MRRRANHEQLQLLRTRRGHLSRFASLCPRSKRGCGEAARLQGLVVGLDGSGPTRLEALGLGHTPDDESRTDIPHVWLEPPLALLPPLFLSRPPSLGEASAGVGDLTSLRPRGKVGMQLLPSEEASVYLPPPLGPKSKTGLVLPSVAFRLAKWSGCLHHVAQCLASYASQVLV